MYRKYFKRVFDFLFSLIIFLIISPLFVLIYILVLIKVGKPVLFTQERPGLNGKIFKIYKFRTMAGKRDKNGDLLPDFQRITKLGSYLRRYSLDELPELFNILKGEMSLIGPRPLLIEYLPLYSREQARRHDVLPGLTGWAQINGRNAITWDEKFRLDLFYVDHISLVLDLKIMILTVWKVLKREGINSGVNETMPMFTGS